MLRLHKHIGGKAVLIPYAGHFLKLNLMTLPKTQTILWLKKPGSIAMGPVWYAEKSVVW